MNKWDNGKRRGLGRIQGTSELFTIFAPCQTPFTTLRLPVKYLYDGDGKIASVENW